MWAADKLVYRGEDDFIRAYQGSELVWEKPSSNNKIYYTTSNGTTVSPTATGFDAGIVSNTYSEGQGVIEFDGVLTNIGVNAFHNCTYMTSITLPDSITNIGSDAFDGCIRLRTVNIPSGVTGIGGAAFYGCRSLTSINIPEGVTSIGNLVFWNCRSLTSIDIPSSVTSIGEDVFQYCPLTSITVDAGNTVYDSRNDCNAIINTSLNEVVYGCVNTIIPSSVVSIGDGAFKFISALTSISIPSSVTSIGSSSFADSGLTSISIPYVNSIGGSAFDNCVYLTSVTLSDNLTVINAGTFSNCRFTAITLPRSLMTIGNSAFENCSKLTSITIPNTVTSIGSYAFDVCRELVEVVVNPVTPPSLGNYAFYENASGRKIKVPAASLQAYKTATGWSTYASEIVSQ